MDKKVDNLLALLTHANLCVFLSLKIYDPYLLSQGFIVYSEDSARGHNPLQFFTFLYVSRSFSPVNPVKIRGGAATVNLIVSRHSCG